MVYKHLSEEERRNLHAWRQEGYGIREIARLLRRAPSSITRELDRNTGQRGYRHGQAQAWAVQRARRPAPRTFTEPMRQEVELRLRRGETPDMIHGRAHLEKRAMVCKERIYQYVYADAKRGGNLWEHLPRAKRKRHRRCPRQEGRGRGQIPDQRRIDTRPPEVETRQSVGHWEGDLITGAPGTGHLVTLVERKTRFSLVGRVQSKEAGEVSERIARQFAQVPKSARLTVTFDNGKEFSLHKEMARQNVMEVFFAYPYHSWERGTNENTNGLIRRLHPKRSSFADIGVAELDRIDRYLNDRPRKCLDWHTPREALQAFLGVAL